MPTLKQVIDEALEKMDSSVPEITPEVIEQLQQLQAKMESFKNQPPPVVPDGVHHGSLNSEYLRTLRDGLAMYRNVVLPAMMKQEVGKLRSVGAMAEALDKTGEFSDPSQDLAGASTGPSGVPGGPGQGGGPEDGPEGR